MPDPANTVAALWAEYAEAVFMTGVHYSDTQRACTEDAFYAGAFSVFQLIDRIAHTLPEDEAAAVMVAIDHEMRAYIEARLAEGSGPGRN